MEIILNGERIPSQVCDQEVQRALREAPQLPRAEAEARARESLIARGLLRQNAFNSGIGVSGDEVETEYSRLMTGYGGEAQFYARMGLSRKQHEKRLKRDLQERIRVDKFVAELTREVVAGGEEAVEDYCREHASEMVRPPFVRASHVGRPLDAAAAQATYREMVSIRHKLLDGMDFAQIAREHPGCDDSLADAGLFPPGRMEDELDVALFSMRPAEVSPVIVTMLGYHILKVWETQAERPLSHEEALDEARARLLARAREEHLAGWIAAKRQVAVIEVREGPSPGGSEI